MTTFISVVLNSFIRNRLKVKSNDFMSDLYDCRFFSTKCKHDVNSRAQLHRDKYQSNAATDIWVVYMIVIPLRHIALVNDSASVHNDASHYPGALYMELTRIAVAHNESYGDILIMPQCMCRSNLLPGPVHSLTQQSSDTDRFAHVHQMQ